MVRAFNTQGFPGVLVTNTNYPPQNFSDTGGVIPVESFNELIEETVGVFGDLLFEETAGVFGNVIIDETGRLNNYDNEVVEEILTIFDNLVVEEVENTFNNAAILESA